MNIMNMVSEERTFGVEIEFYGPTREALIEAVKSQGLEIEYEGYTHRTTAHWKIVTDSSVHGSSGERGLELVSPILKGLDGINQINKVCIALKSVDAKVNKTCGLHLHLDARDLTLQDWKNTLTFYYNYQEGIDKLMPKSRRDNDYCNHYSENELRRIQKCRSLEELFDTCHDRYKVINVSSFLRHGTIEMREHSGTVEFEKIVEWLQFCIAVINKGKSVKSLDIWKQADEEKQFEALMVQLKKVGVDSSSITYYKNRKNQLQAKETANLRECI